MTMPFIGTNSIIQQSRGKIIFLGEKVYAASWDNQADKRPLENINICHG
jgi:hypothetical protein